MLRRDNISIFFGVLLLCAVFTPQAGSSVYKQQVSDRFILNAEKDHFDHLNKYLWLLTDSTGNINIQEISNQHIISGFRPFDYSEQLSPANVYWGKIEIENHLPNKTNWLLHVAEVGTNFIEVFVKKNDTDHYELKKTGEYVIFEEKSLPKKRDCTVFIDLPYQQTTTLFIRIKNIDGRRARFDIQLATPENYIQRIAKTNTTSGLYTSIILIILLYSLFSFYLNKDFAFLYFGLFSAGIGFYFIYEQGLALSTFAKQMPYIQPLLLWLSVLTIIPHFQFIRYFAEKQTFTGKWQTIFKWSQLTIWAVFGLGLAVLLFSFNVVVLNYLLKIMATATFFLTAWVMVHLIRSQTEGRYFLVAAYLLFAAAIAIGGYLSLLWDSSSPSQFVQPGLMASVITMIFGLKYRNKRIDQLQKDAQHSLIEQLRESESARAQLNAHLEEKIKERSIKLDQHQQEIAMQAKELVEMNWEMHEKNEAFKRSNKELELTNQKLLQKNEELKVLNHKLNQTLAQLKETQVQLIHSEKMASIGLLTAGIAHEINNPINFVYAGTDTLASTLQEVLSVVEHYDQITINSSPSEVLAIIKEIEALKATLDFAEGKEDIFALINDIKEGASRTAEIVRGLRNFSRLDEEQAKMVNIHEGIDSTLALLRNKIKNGIEVERLYDPELPATECFPGQINQVFMNILVNAVQAINQEEMSRQKGKIEIKTMSLVPAGMSTDQAEAIEIHISDNGAGMPEEVKNRIFEPFFTTKKVGEGTGLGLPISMKIIEKHKGQISVESQPNMGTTFIITLPTKQAPEVA